MSSLSEFNKFTSSLPKKDYLMPVLFIGHGSPMNGIEDNEFSQGWAQMAKEIPVPVAVLVVSAHWLTEGTMVTAMESPRTIHDFGGFPQALYEVQYKAPGFPILAEETVSLIHISKASLDHEWGLDHGAWSVVRHMYPNANVPVLELSIDYTQGAQYHYDLAKQLYSLRSKGILIIGSGNMVHNLRMIAWDKMNVPGYGYDWALQINDRFKQLIDSGDSKTLISYQHFKESKLAIPTPEHYLPLIYSMGLRSNKDPVSIFNDKAYAGSITMTSVKFG
jgi:4,5-DOPA dioxygenase extradiol